MKHLLNSPFRPSMTDKCNAVLPEKRHNFHQNQLQKFNESLEINVVVNFSTECDTLPIFCKANANAVSSTQTNNTTKTTRFSRKSNEILMNISNSYHACLFGQHHKSSTIDLIFEYRHEIHIYAVDNHLNCHHRCLPFFVVIPTMIAEKAQPNANTINFKMSILYRSE